MGDRDAMLGRAVRELNRLPDNTVGTLINLAARLHNKEQFARLKRFCRGEILLTEPELPSFILNVRQGETFNGLIKVGNYDWKHHSVTSELFPVRPCEPSLRRIVLLHFKRGVRSEEVLKEAEAQGFKRPTYEDCLRFGAGYPEEQRKGPIVFLHEPVQVNGGPSVLCLGHIGSRRRLDCGWFACEWGDCCRFALVSLVCPTA